MGIVTCGGCGIKFNRNTEDAEFIKSKWYHKGCAAIKHEKMDLDGYICKLFSLKTPGPINNVLIKKYRDEFGYSYDGMQKALKYFYEVKRHSPNNSEERIGIIPYVYQDSQDYFQYLTDRSERVGRHGLTEKPDEINITLCPSQKTDKKPSNKNELDSLFDGE